MDIFEEIVNKPTIPTAGPNKFQHYAELLTTAAVTQIYHDMIEAGLKYGYLTNGHAVVFLNIDPEIGCFSHKIDVTIRKGGQALVRGHLAMVVVVQARQAVFRREMLIPDHASWGWLHLRNQSS